MPHRLLYLDNNRGRIQNVQAGMDAIGVDLQIINSSDDAKHELAIYSEYYDAVVVTRTAPGDRFLRTTDVGEELPLALICVGPFTHPSDIVSTHHYDPDPEHALERFLEYRFIGPMIDDIIGSVGALQQPAPIGIRDTILYGLKRNAGLMYPDAKPSMYAALHDLATRDDPNLNQCGAVIRLKEIRQGNI